MRLSDLSRLLILRLSAILAISLAAFIACANPAQPESSISSSQLAAMLGSESPSPRLILDVRTREEFAQGHVPGAVNIPHTELQSRLSEVAVSPSTPVIVYCQSGGRAHQAESILREAGFANVLDLQGHMGEWRAKQLPIEKGPNP